MLGKGQCRPRSAVAAVGITNQRETTIVWDRAHWAADRERHCLAGHPDRTAGARSSPATGLNGMPPAACPRDLFRRAPRSAGCSMVEGRGAGGSRRPALRHHGHGICGISPAAWTVVCTITDVDEREPDAADGSARRCLGRTCARPSACRWRCPEIRLLERVYGGAGPGSGWTADPVAGILGDQQAATFRAGCLDARGMARTPMALAIHAAQHRHRDRPIRNGLLTTVCYRLGGRAGGLCAGGIDRGHRSLVQWLRDNLGIIGRARCRDFGADASPTTAVPTVVPAFSGLFAPYWRPDARGAIVGLTGSDKGHIARGAEATAYQSLDVLRGDECRLRCRLDR